MKTKSTKKAEVPKELTSKEKKAKKLEELQQMRIEHSTRAMERINQVLEEEDVRFSNQYIIREDGKSTFEIGIVPNF